MSRALSFRDFNKTLASTNAEDILLAVSEEPIQVETDASSSSSLFSDSTHNRSISYNSRSSSVSSRRSTSFSSAAKLSCLCTSVFIGKSGQQVYLVSPFASHTCLAWDSRRCEVEKLALVLLAKFPDASCQLPVITGFIRDIILNHQHWTDFNFDPLFAAGVKRDSKDLLLSVIDHSHPTKTQPVLLTSLNRQLGGTDTIYWDQLLVTCVANIASQCDDYIATVRKSAKRRQSLSTKMPIEGGQRRLSIVIPKESPSQLLRQVPPCVQTLIQVGEMKERLLLSSYLPYEDTKSTLGDTILFLVDAFDTKRTQRASHVQSARHTSQQNKFPQTSFSSFSSLPKDRDSQKSLNARFTHFASKAGVDVVYKAAIRQHEETSGVRTQTDPDTINIFGFC